MTYEQLAEDRIYGFTRSPLWVGVVRALCAHHDTIDGVIPDLIDALSLNGTPNLPALEQIGTILQRPNPGYSAARYQALLRTWTRLLGSGPNADAVMSAVLDFTGENPTTYVEYYPLGYIVGAVATGDAIDILIDLLRLVRPATYSVGIVFSDTTEVLMCDSTANPAPPAAPPGNLASSSALVTTDTYEIGILRRL